MRYSVCINFLLVVLAFSVFSKAELRQEDHKAAQLPMSLTPADNSMAEGMELLKVAESEAVVLDGKMRAWVLWQVGLAYQPVDKSKALQLFETAFTTAHSVREDGPAAKSKPDPLAWITGHPSLPPGLRLEADIAWSILISDPRRADQILQQADPAIRSSILTAVLAHQEKEQQFGQARETLNRITAQDEMPYEHAMRLMDTLKPEQSNDLTQLFTAALASYRNHAPHLQARDMFPVMLSRYWNRLPREVSRQAIDEIGKQATEADQAADPNKKGLYSVTSEKGTTALSIREYKLLQIMPVLRELDPSAARRYMEEYPALATNGLGNLSGVTSDETAKAPGSTSFHPSASYGSIMTSARELPMAQKAAAKVDEDRADEAMAAADAISDPGLRAQTYEYIARVTSKKQDSTAARALQQMLRIAEKIQPKDAFPYYGSAAGIYMHIGQADDAKKSIQDGLAVADKLYKADSDNNDPNTAPKAFWPSTNAYCTMLHAAARVSHTWAISLLQDISDPEVKVAAETALAGGWLNAPIGPATIMISKKSSNSFSLSGRE